MKYRRRPMRRHPWLPRIYAAWYGRGEGEITGPGLEHKTVAPASLTSLRRAQLLDDGDPGIRHRAQALLSRVGDDRAAVLKGYQEALTLPRDAERGRRVFEKHCTACHRLHGQGFEVGPDLMGVRVRPDATLLADVLDPSGAIASGFTSYTVATDDGRVFTGILAAETATSVALRREKAKPKRSCARISTRCEPRAGRSCPMDWRRS